MDLALLWIHFYNRNFPTFSEFSYVEFKKCLYIVSGCDTCKRQTDTTSSKAFFSLSKQGLLILLISKTHLAGVPLSQRIEYSDNIRKRQSWKCYEHELGGRHSTSGGDDKCISSFNQEIFRITLLTLPRWR
jgi:hypothetical protein